jgi:DNA-binding NarL/FixJ family response regulator
MAGPPSQPHVPLVTMCTTDEDVIQRVADLFGVAYCRTSKRKEHWKQAYRVNLRGFTALQVMQELRPLMGSRRQKQIDKAMACYERKPNRGGRELPPETVRRIRKLADSGHTNVQISMETGIEQSTVSRIKNRVTYADME